MTIDDNEQEESRHLDKKDLEMIKEAAKEGAREGAKEIARHSGGESRKSEGHRGKGLLKLVVAIVAVVLVFFLAVNYLNPLKKVKDQLSKEPSASEHDLVLQDRGILGYTAADFAEAVLGEQSKLCKLEVLKQEVSDVSTITNAGLGNFKIFSKNQLITYHGTAIYTVDLSQLKKNDFVLDEEDKTLTIYIPEPVLEPINIPSDKIEFGDVSRGLLAFGDVKMTVEQSSEVQTSAEKMMEQKLTDDKVIEDAERFAKLSVWEMYQPIVNGVAKGYSLVVDFD